MRKRRLKREHGRRRNPQSVRNEADASALAQSPRLVGEDTRGADRPWRSRGSEWGGLQQSRYVLSFGHSLARDCVLGFSLIRWDGEMITAAAVAIGGAASDKVVSEP